MLKTRNLVILAVVLVALLLVRILQDRSHEQATSQPGVTTVVPGPLDVDDLGSIVIGYGDDPQALVLERQPDGWVVATAWDADANRSRVEALVDALDGLQGEYRSDAADVLADYGFTDSTTVTITVREADGSDLATIELGRKPARARAAFVKRAGESTVYVAAEPVLSRLGVYGQEPQAPRARHFLELQAHKVDREEVAAITLHGEEGELVLQKEFPETLAAPEDTATVAALAGEEHADVDPDAEADDATAAADAAAAATSAEPEPDTSIWEWRLGGPGGKAAVKTRADGVLGAVASVRAVDVDDPRVDPASYGLADPVRVAVLTLLDGSEVTLAFGDSREAGEDGEPAGTYLRVDDDPTVWVVSDYVVKNIFKTREDLLPDEG